MMRRHASIASVASGVGVLAVIVASLAWAQDESRFAKSPRGGLKVTTAHYRFEVFFYETGARVFATTAGEAAIDASRLAGSVTFYHPNASSAWFARPLTSHAGESLDVGVTLTNAPERRTKAVFEVNGLPDPSEPTARFTLPLEFVAPRSEPAEAPVAAPTTAPYVSAHGYYGAGYYRNSEYTAPASGGDELGNIDGTPGFRYGETSVGPGHRDWSAGRTLPLAKPWLQPID
jgi:hypothetical protein